LYTSQIAQKPHTPTSALNSSDSSPSTTTNKMALAQAGSNQLSLETPQNGAGTSQESGSHIRLLVSTSADDDVRFLALVEYVLSTMDKVVNWARQGSMWPMTCEFGRIQSVNKFLYLTCTIHLPLITISQSVSHVAP
jgi:NADH dehydrogenase (ubiquinone) Fe-S protein 7